MKKFLLALLLMPACYAFAQQSESESNLVVKENEMFSVSAFYGAFIPSYGESSGCVGASLTFGHLYLDGLVTPRSYTFGGVDANSYNIHLGIRLPVSNIGLTPVIGFAETKPEHGVFLNKKKSMSSIDYGAVLDYHPSWQKGLKFSFSMTKYNCYAGIGFYL